MTTDKKIEIVKHVFVIGAKSLGRYGGFETFVRKLIEYSSDYTSIKYHIACKKNGYGCEENDNLKKYNEFNVKNANCFLISVPEHLGSLQAIIYDCKAINESIKKIKNENIKNPVVYILACRIGPFIRKYYSKVHKLGGKIYLNPDGHEWKRNKWPLFVKIYWKYSEKLMIKYSDIVICDSRKIEEYVKSEYGNYKPTTKYISYGAENRKSIYKDNNVMFLEWLNRNQVDENGYFLLCGRFVKENNYEVIIREFMRSNSKRKLVIITTKNNKLLSELRKKTQCYNDKRIIFSSAIYDQELLMKIREKAFAYIHGHEVGGTNPSLLESLSSTKLNLLLDVDFNREVAEEAGLYWNKNDFNLANLIDRTEKFDDSEIEKLSRTSKKRIKEMYNWNMISEKYLKLFLECK